MPQTKPDYMLVERGRYYYQRKVPLDLQPAIGVKKWRAPLGKDFDEAFDKLRDLKRQHDALIIELADTEARKDFQTKTRRSRENSQAQRDAETDRAYDDWCRAQGFKTNQEEFDHAFPEFVENPWRQAAELVSAIEGERSRHLPPSDDDIDSIKRVLDHIEGLPSGERPTVKLSPFAEFKKLLAQLPTEIQSLVRFEPQLPDAMDDDEFFDRLNAVHVAFFGDEVSPPKNPELRDEFDFAKMALERKIARVARDPDTIKRVAERFYAFAEVRATTVDKYRRTIERLIKEVGNIPVSQVTPRMLRDYRDKLRARGLLPSSIRSEFSPIMGMFGYAVDEELIEFSPMVSVKLPKERRAVEESKWLPFEVEECQRIFAALEDVWAIQSKVSPKSVVKHFKWRFVSWLLPLCGPQNSCIFAPIRLMIA